MNEHESRNRIAAIAGERRRAKPVAPDVAVPFDPPIPVTIDSPGSIFHGRCGVAIGWRDFGAGSHDVLVETMSKFGRARIGFSRSNLDGDFP